jgi:predicted transposase/invertase (TIGR01784 family)
VLKKNAYICRNQLNNRAMKEENYIRFDWAVKRLLRNKANFGVLEGFLTTLMEEEIHIVEILESESNQQHESDKFNRVDIKAKNSKGEIIIVEIQNTRELYYLERILYGVAKAITEHINVGDSYSSVKKVYSISIIYFGSVIQTLSGFYFVLNLCKYNFFFLDLQMLLKAVVGCVQGRRGTSRLYTLAHIREVPFLCV